MNEVLKVAILILAILCLISSIAELISVLKTRRVKFAKLHPEAVLPYKDNENGCYDLFACFDEEEFRIPSHEVKLIPTGLCSAFDKKYMAHVRERGSNTKSNLKVSAGVIDSGYRGEWFVALYNGNKLPVVISKEATEVKRTRSEITVPYNKAIAQFAIEEVPSVKLVYTSAAKVQEIKSKRGKGKLGSTDKK